MRILVTGGCGYKGSVLIPLLLGDGHEVINVDTQWFGDFLHPHPSLRNLKLDIRDISNIPFDGVEAVIHLANIANDPAVELSPLLSWEVNVLAGAQLIDKALRSNVSQFIYASSGSVYGVNDSPNVTENLQLLPITAYNKTKMAAERIFLSYKDSMSIHCIRPATVCGPSPRMRLDVSVNMFTYQALSNRVITVFGGSQVRPNIHILDMANVYRHFLSNPQIPSGCYNAGFENISISRIAQLVNELIPSEIVTTPSNDPRSYRQDSTKLINTGFSPSFDVTTAIRQFRDIYETEGFRSSDSCYTVKTMKRLKLDLLTS